MLRCRAVRTVIDLPIERGDTTAMMSSLMRINAKLDEITRLLTEDDDGEEKDEP